jgi:hypothetical protein
VFVCVTATLKGKDFLLAKISFPSLLLVQEKDKDEWKRSNQLMDHIEGKTFDI